MEGYGKDRAAQQARDAAAEAVRQARDAAAEAVRRDAAMVQAQQEIAAAANAAATREEERVRMLETSDRERIAAASRLFARRANEVRRTLADSLTLSAARYAAFSDSTSVILSDLFVADPSASSARIADELRPVYRQFQRQRQEFERMVGATASRVMQGKRPLSNAVEIKELVLDINALYDDPLSGSRGATEQDSLAEAVITRHLDARTTNDQSCRALAITCDPTRLDAAARRAYAAASATRRAETARRLPQLQARLDRVLDSLNATTQQRADAHSHYLEVGYEYIATAPLFVSRQLAIGAERQAEQRQAEQRKEYEAKWQELRRLASSLCGSAPRCVASGEYSEKYGTDADSIEKAAAFYDAACLLGDPRGCVELGAMYEAGRGVQRSLVEAAKAYERGCLLQDSAACGNLLRIRK